jgi:lantibiotic modifying enzyme
MVDGAPQWDEIKLLGEGRTVSQIGGCWLYDGSAGVGLFLAEAARFSEDPTLTRVAEKALRALRKGYGLLERPIGAFDGAAGLVLADLRMGDALGQTDHHAVRRRLEHIRSAAESDDGFDIISGVSGACLVALQAARSPDLTLLALDAAHACAKRLQALAERHEVGVAWSTPRFERALTGFAHGACGPALALASAGKAFDHQPWLDLAWDALRYEARTRDLSTGRWSDLRVEGEGAFTMAWCHGTPGMTLARLLIQEQQLADEPTWLQTEIDAGLAATQGAAEISGDGLCHGRLGNMEPLFRRASTRPFAERHIKEICRQGEHLGWQSEFSTLAPSLMTGLAGIGHALLRSVDPRVGSVLCLEIASPPAAKPQGLVREAPGGAMALSV